MRRNFGAAIALMTNKLIKSNCEPSTIKLPNRIPRVTCYYMRTFGECFTDYRFDEFTTAVN